MARKIVAVVVGYLVWTLIWLGAGALLFGKMQGEIGQGRAVTEAGPLSLLLVVSVICSVSAGVCVGLILRGRALTGSAITLGVLLLLTGIGVQAGVWNLMPVWYHLVFLALLMPATIASAKLAGGVRT